MAGWDRVADVLVVGFGAAGGVAAIEAHDANASTIILEKMPDPGGLSAVSAGGIRVCTDVEDCYRYLLATSGGRTPDNIMRGLAEGMFQVPDYVRKLAKTNGAEVTVTPALGNYPFPGYESLAYCQIARVPELDGAAGYRAIRGIKEGTKLFKVLEDNVTARNIPVLYNAAAERLIRDADGTIIGLTATVDGKQERIRARKAVILACGGYEHSEEMKRQYFQAQPVLTGSFVGNTGDGIRMAQEVGADLWHMWHYHGPYGMKHSDPDYPLAFYMKAVPMWTPGRMDQVSDLGVTDAAGKPVSQKSLARMAWILVDQNGRRFMDEYPPYPGDTGIRPFDAYDSKQQKFPRIPAFVVLDEEGRKMYPIGRAIANSRDYHYQWSADNSKEVELGILHRAPTLAALAEQTGIKLAALEKTIVEWNDHCARRHDPDFGRQPDSMVPIKTAPFYWGHIYPVVINTQGGPVHDIHQQVLNPFGEPIPRLYAAGELGSKFGHLYMGGGNLAECFVGGWTAGRHAAGLPSLVD
jgi:succinate dehydrogenase/fumarate reductase flavoprotein subunit